jgi:hypothetical protein
VFDGQIKWPAGLVRVGGMEIKKCSGGLEMECERGGCKSGLCRWIAMFVGVSTVT